MPRKVALLAAAALVLRACGSADEPATTQAAAATTTTAAPATTTTAAPATATAAPTHHHDDSSANHNHKTTTTTTTTVPPTTTTFVPTHGNDAVGVYLGVAPPRCRHRRHAGRVPGCDRHGSRHRILRATQTWPAIKARLQGLGLADGYYNAVSVLFATMDDATAFADAYPGDVVGIAAVKTYCLD